VAKKLDDIRKQLNNEADNFFDYLYNSLDGEIVEFLTILSEETNAYLFSGIIRDYFLKRYRIRDVDIVVESDENIENIIEKFEYRQNSYGGYKIHTKTLDIDLWNIHKTWALNNSQTTLNFDLEKYIPTTAFFNFSAILYSLNEKQFYYSRHFLSFLRDKEIDVVFEPNANYQLCIVNSFYYADRYNLRISERLKKLIYKFYKREESDYSNIQDKHFGRLIYTNDEIDRRIKALSI
jgi:hypothetical protein